MVKPKHNSLSTISKDCLVLNKCNIKERLKKRYHDVSIMKINEISIKFEEIILINKVFFTEKNDNMNLDNYYEVLSKYLEKFNKNIKFNLLADEKIKVIKKYKVWRKKKFMGREFMGIIRSTFLIDKKGKILRIWDNVKVKDHAKEVLKTLEKIQKK